jgi:apolipoprotein N-acyltransferase
LLALAFPPLHLWPLSLVAWVPLWYSLDRPGPLSGSGRRSWHGRFLQGWTMGIVAFVGILHWLVALSNEEVTIDGLMVPALLLLGAYLGLFFGLAALFSTFLARRTGLSAAFWGPICWTLAEYLRSLGPLGVTWGGAPYALARVNPLLQSASVWGFWGLYFGILAVGGCLAGAVRGWRPGWIAAPLLVSAAWLHGIWLVPELPGVTAPPPAPGGVREASRAVERVLVIQPDVRREIKWKPERREEVIDTVVSHGQRAVGRFREAGGFDWIVWPETVLPTRLLDDPYALGRVRMLAGEAGRPILLGTQEGYWARIGDQREWVAHNSALVARPDGSFSSPYRKIRLVPFSERMPLQKIAPWIRSIDFGQSNFFPGTRPALLEVDSTRVGCLICFEAAFPDLPRTMVRAGAELLVNITNDFWFERTAGPRQHADMAILRCVENRVPMVRCANTGISFAADAYGRVTHETGLFERTAFTAQITPRAGGSFATRIGDAWIVLLLIASAGVVWLRRGRAGGTVDDR